jgi:exopolysaccharide biosynthesis polyprenyl glycosylphosphotransferase
MAIVQSSKDPDVTPTLALVGMQDAQAARPGAEPGVGRWLYLACGKRAADVLLASTLLLLTLPLMLVVAAAIRLDSPGPILFRQRRVGRNGTLFTILKFRSMTHEDRRDLRLVADADGTLRHKVRNDPRVTRVGRWLRRTSLDELPQLLNVVAGQMSLIGPRPELPEIVTTYEPWQHRRHLVRPGLTGWWQVSGRSDRPMHENTELDLYYVNNLSLWLDLLIVLKTFRAVVRGSGAF